VLSSGSEAEFSRDEISDLRRLIAKNFNMAELGELAFDLGVPFMSLAGSTREMKSLELLVWARRRDQLAKLLELLREARPTVAWPAAPR